MNTNVNKAIDDSSYVHWKDVFIHYLTKYLSLICKALLVFFFFINVQMFIIYYYYPEMWDNTLIHLLHNKESLVKEHISTQVIIEPSSSKKDMVFSIITSMLSASLILGVSYILKHYFNGVL